MPKVNDEIPVKMYLAQTKHKSSVRLNEYNVQVLLADTYYDSQ